ncbi:hypothetical protein [Streptomyces mobaraensis]|uniref:Uncharacterized protein n=1 Tax=Streptomyces mobaraensis TaxID=35621 RepID=A0A5N5W329_STRMB|nr:hypothetical protein [Streptomyces mobaraensis]KAB7835766.1 hypothetical protein FRZ00_26465 [Streptomyces mobaraensis]
MSTRSAYGKTCAHRHRPGPLFGGMQGGDASKFKVAPNPNGVEEAGSGAGAETVPPSGANDRTDTTGASVLGPTGAQALRIISSEPDQRWTPKLLAVRLEGNGADEDEKAHNRARALMDALAK